MAPSSRKKAKKSSFVSKNVVLKALVGMPMDIIFEIFGYLDPLDLLQLARTTKELRAILMSRSSLSLWKRVRHAYYQMPDGPEGMSEPQYISLALDPTCDGCGGSELNHVYIFWNAQLKSCRQCEPALSANTTSLTKFNLYKVLPSWLVRLFEEPFSTNQYSLKQAQIWSQEYASLNGSSADMELKLEWWKCQIMEKHALTKKHMESFRSWSFVRQREMAAERSRLIEAMNEALLVRLEELGWGEEISKMYPYQRYNMCLTLSIHPEPGSFSQVWSSHGPAILKALKAIRTARIKKERQMLLSSRYVVLQEIYNEYIRGLPADSDALIPNIADVALSPPVHSILADERTDFIVTRQTFENINLMQTLPSIVSDWKIRLDDELIRMVQVKLSEPFTKDQLLLATTVFYCDACHMDLFYPRVLVHHCPPSYGIIDLVQCPAWNSSRKIKFNRDIHQAAIDIIDILGLDPKAVTAEDMTNRNSVLQCLDCRTTRQGRMTMIWSRAIEHSRKEHHRLPSMVSWNVPGHDGQLTLQARLARELAKSDHLDLVRLRFMCGVCRLKATLVELNKHLLVAHKIQNPGEHDILLHPDAIHAPMPCVLPETD